MLEFGAMCITERLSYSNYIGQQKMSYPHKWWCNKLNQVHRFWSYSQYCPKTSGISAVNNMYVDYRSSLKCSIMTYDCQ